MISSSPSPSSLAARLDEIDAAIQCVENFLAVQCTGHPGCTVPHKAFLSLVTALREAETASQVPTERPVPDAGSDLEPLAHPLGLRLGRIEFHGACDHTSNLTGATSYVT